MATTLLLLPEEISSATPEFHYVLSPDGRQVAAHGNAAAALLPAPARAGVVLVLPARAVSWSRLSLPTRVAASVLGFKADPVRLRSVIAGALEDLLLDEPQRLHFATFAVEGPATGDGMQALWVATCQREWLQTGMQALEAASIPVQAIVAECEPQDGDRPAQMFWVGTPQDLHILLATEEGVCVLPHSAAALALAAAQSDVLGFAEPAVMGPAEAHAGTQVVLQTAPERWLTAAASSRNLAQGELSAARNARWAKAIGARWQTLLHAPHWRPVRWGVVLLALIHVGGLNALAWQEKSQITEQRAMLRNSLLRSFPHVTVVIDPALQMQRELELLALSRGTSTGVNLAQVLPLVVPQSSSAWSAMDLDGGQLRIQGSGLQEKDLATVNASLQAQGLVAVVQGDTLVVRSKGAN